MPVPCKLGQIASIYTTCANSNIFFVRAQVVDKCLLYKQPWEAQGHRDSITSEELLKEIQRIPIQTGDGKGSFAVRSKTLRGSNDANCIAFLVMKTCFLNLASSSMHSASPPLSRCAHCKGESVSAPNNLDPSVEIMEPQNVELKHSILHLFSQL